MPGEFFLYVEGWKQQEDVAWQRTAQLASWIMAPHVKSTISANELLGKESSAPLILPGMGGTAKEWFRKARDQGILK